jgi:hypothetical protein
MNLIALSNLINYVAKGALEDERAREIERKKMSER